MKTAVDATPRRSSSIRTYMDATSVLTFYAFLLLAIPSDQSIAALGGAGAPSTIFGLGMLLWWAWHNLQNASPHSVRRLQPVRTALVFFLVCVMTSYVLAALMPLPYVDGNGSTMTLVNVASYAGVILVANDGVQDRGRFLALLKRLAIMGGLYALVGVLQFFSSVDFMESFQIPGLTSTGLGGVDVRGGFIRSESTARHPLEYAAVLAMLLPVALTLAIRDTSRGFLLRFLPAGVMFLAAFVSVTRSALLGIAAGLIVLFPTWERRLRMKIAAAGVAGIGILYFFVPGLGGTIFGMFSGSDPSVDSRTSSIDVAFGYLSLEPSFGRGLGTMSPMYRIFDNQYFGLLIEVGLVGTLSFLALVLVGTMSTFLRHSRSDQLLGDLGPALAGGVLAGALLCAFFDAFHFPQAVGMLMMMLGLCGAYWNVKSFREAEAGKPLIRGRLFLATAGFQHVVAVLRRRWYVVVAVLLLTVPAVIASMEVKGVYYTKFEMGFEAPAAATKNNALRTEGSTTVNFAAVVQRIYEGTHPNPVVIPTTAPLYGTGIRDATAVYLPNSGGQWQSNFNKPSVVVEIVRSSPEAVLKTAAEVSGELQKLATTQQEALGIWESAQISTNQRPGTVDISYIGVRTKYALVGIATLGLGLAFASAIYLDRAIQAVARRRESQR
ncbi:O-antigen polymerase [Arthrobacter rhombi]|uniref:O-antigen polymerase n=3 Tax=Arthrobacter rhombi TaxID=71253 RepID=A0A1R4GV31_9MICC|nr:O-antigen polymerase [Arthrobacter rhombi]